MAAAAAAAGEGGVRGDNSAGALLRIFVGGLPESVCASDLEGLFAFAGGRVAGVEFVRTNGRSFAYVDFHCPNDKALAKLFSTYNGRKWKGGKLRLEKAKEHYVTRLKREWEQDADAAASKEAALKDNAENRKPKLDKAALEGMKINIYFPKLRKVKALPLKGTGKHKYSFRHIEVPSYPIHFCDCEEHCGPPEEANNEYASVLNAPAYEKEANNEEAPEEDLDDLRMSASASVGQNAAKLKKISKLLKLKTEETALQVRMAQLSSEIAQLSSEIARFEEGEDRPAYSYDVFLKMFNYRGTPWRNHGLYNSKNICITNETWCLLCALRRHIFMARQICSSFYPSEISSRMQLIGEGFVLGSQQDASEFMIYAKSKMESDYFTMHFENAETPVENIIHHLFAGVLRSEVTCSECKAVSPSYHKMMEIAVGIQDGAPNLHDCLKFFTAPEHLADEYSCAQCKDKVKAHKRLSIFESPNIFTITLNRFESFEVNRVRKLDNTICYPLELDITEYMSSPGRDNMYDLYAVICHVGATMASGHYTCYAKGYDDKWLFLDDSSVTNVSEDRVLAQQRGAYMLLYIRKTARAEPPMDTQAMVQQKADGGPAADERAGQTDNKEKEKTTVAPYFGTRSLLCPLLTEGSNTIFKERSLANSTMTKLGLNRIKDSYLVSEDIDKAVVLKKIKKALKFYEQTGHFELPKRGNNFFIYDEDLMQLCMLKKGKYLTKSSEKAKRMAVLLKEIRRHLQSNTFIQQRTIYYIHKSLFEHKSHLTEKSVSEVGSLLGFTRKSLNIIVSSSGGSIIGPIVLCANSCVRIDCSTSGTGGSKIPHEAHQIDRIEEKTTVRFILIVEKQTVFSILTELGFHTKYSCIILTGAGQPDLATRAIVYKLRCRFGVPIYGFVDANPAGVRIMCTYRFGSETRAFDNLELTVPELKWIGLCCVDLEWKANLELLSEVDYAILLNLLNLPHVRSDVRWYRDLQRMVEFGLKGDIERVLDYHEIEGYLSARIPEMDITRISV